MAKKTTKKVTKKPSKKKLYWLIGLAVASVIGLGLTLWQVQQQQNVASQARGANACQMNQGVCGRVAPNGYVRVGYSCGSSVLRCYKKPKTNPTPRPR